MTSSVMQRRARRVFFVCMIGALPTSACGDGTRAASGLADTTGGAGLRTSTLEAGPPLAEVLIPNAFEGDARQIAEGQRLYGWMNCAGCHGPKGGGGIGPPLADQDWIYGGESEHIFQAIMQGRPNGMPSYRGKLTEASAWRIAAYVRSLSEEQSGDSAQSTQQGPADQGAQQGNRQ